MTLRHLIIALSVSLSALMASCSMGTSSTGKDFWIDNPTADQITVQVDDQQYAIPAESGVNVYLDWGKHRLTYNNESINFFVKGGAGQPAFINPTQSNYINHLHVFIDQDDDRATEEFIEWIYRVNGDSLLLEIDGRKANKFVSFTVHNDVFIDGAKNSWDYFIDEDMPGDMILSSPIITEQNRSLLNDKNYQAGQFQTTRHKLYREQDFLNYLKRFSDENIKFCSEKKAYSDYTPMKVQLTTIEAINDPEYRDYMTDLQNKTNEWFQMTDPKQVNAVQEELIGVRATIKRNEMRNEYLEKHKGDHNNNLQKQDYSFNEATNEYGEQTSVRVPRTIIGIYVINVLIVE